MSAKLIKKPRAARSQRQLSLDEEDQLAAQHENLQAAHDELEESRNQYAELFDRAPIAYVTINGQGKIIRVNFSAALLLGSKREQLRDMLLTTFAADRDELKKLLEHLRHCRAEEINYRTQLFLKNKKGATLCVELVSHPISGREQFYHTAILDLTPQKKTEIELLRARDEALAAARAKDDFLAALSHELRTPLNPVLLIASESANDAALPKNVRASFAMIRKNVELEARLIEDLLDLTRITRGKLTMDSCVTDLHAILRDAFATVSHDVHQKQLILEWNLTDEPLIVAGDPVRLQQVFWNVLKNAVKFTPANGKISITTRSLPGDRVSVAITDSGMGMTPTELARVFNAFSQGDHAGGEGKHQFGGLGLGLSISKMLAELHGGSIRAASPGRGQGATFTIEFPLAKIVNAGATSSRQNNSAHPAAAPAGEIRILLVEDHEPTRIALKFLLQRRHYHVADAGSVSEAKKIAAAETFQLLISDIGLPDGSGFDLMTEFQRRRGVKGIALTGYGMEEDIERSKKAGFIAHLVKPVRAEALENALALAINATPSREPAA